ncbi:DUF3570 domain-containing protein [Draconibacterium sp. IB214405]|uniref:DUF3570 domain-containing protein n=1 Tax=Draconibacterium sp. IB214405 TaxID=3097352 RepID=UPI002A0D6064|nr:DUF3570 domain-containing protein [Draconibacterium sp. IB214405]MDX8340424.1 DUF3570 domain-containing protein [Draconibacterium sp. IB214405]
MKYLFSLLLIGSVLAVSAQDDITAGEYKKRVLEHTEIDFLVNYYQQDGENAAVTGGYGTEELQDLSPTIVVAVPLNDDDVLTINANISAYTSASSSNIDPFDGKQPADPFVASSGASKSDVWANVVGSYSHSSEDRNLLWNANLSVSAEFDYTSFGFGGGRTWLFNEKNTELSLNGNIYLDTWKLLYPIELRPEGGSFQQVVPGYDPSFNEHTSKGRNSYSAGIGLSQILSSRMTGYVSADFILQDGLLATPFHRIYFADKEDYFYENFQLADDIEQLPDSRFKIALGARLNYFVNHRVTLRTYYRYYTDDWGITSHTASLEIPVKITDKFTIYPSYRFYNQTAADYFAPYNEHLSTEEYYTSDYDLSKFSANNYGFGVSYTDVFTKSHIWKLGLKSIDAKFHKYDRDSAFSASMFSFGVKFVVD